MFFKGSGGRSVTAFAAIFAIMISEGLTTDEISLLSTLFSSIGSSLQLISVVESGSLPVEEGPTVTASANTNQSNPSANKGGQSGGNNGQTDKNETDNADMD